MRKKITIPPESAWYQDVEDENHWVLGVLEGQQIPDPKAEIARHKSGEWWWNVIGIDHIPGSGTEPTKELARKKVEQFFRVDIPDLPRISF